MMKQYLKMVFTRYILLLIIGIFLINFTSAFTCYQETANQSHSSDGFCNLSYGGSYSFAGTFETSSDSRRTYDGSWSSSGVVQSYSTAYQFINYTKPLGATSAKYRTKYTIFSTTEQNYSIASDCFNNTIVQIRVNATRNATDYTKQSLITSCHNGTEWRPVNYIAYAGAQIWDDGIYWEVNYSTITFNEVYSNTTFETSNEVFILNYSYDPATYISSYANIMYNNSIYTGTVTQTGRTTMASATIPVPLISSAINKSFYWMVYLTNSTGTYSFNTTAKNQTILPAIINRCNATYPTLLINYTIYNESSLNMLNATFKSTFSYSVLNSSAKKTQMFDLPLNSSFLFCSNANITFKINANIKLQSSGFYDRTFNVIDTVSNNSLTNRKLYLLSSQEGTNVILSFKDVGLRGLYGYYMEINRYYPELNGYVAVHQDLTDNFGTVVGSLIENSVKYKFKFYDTNYTLVKTTNDVSIACRSTICTLDFVYDTPINDFDRFNNITNYDYSLIFNNDTSTFIYSWNDNTGATPFHRLVVEKIGYNGTIIVCNSSSTALVGSLSCAVTADGSYSAQAFRSASPERRVFILNKKIGLENDAGREGLIWSFILTMTMIGVGMYNPAVGIGLYLFVFIVLGTIGILYVNPVILIAEIVMGVAFIWAFRS